MYRGTCRPSFAVLGMLVMLMGCSGESSSSEADPIQVDINHGQADAGLTGGEDVSADVGGGCELDSNAEHCGGCDEACSEGDRCVEGVCQAVVDCQEGFRECSGACVPCPAGAGIAATACDEGQCVVSSCAQDYELCGGSCAPCPMGDPNGSLQCDGNRCVVGCDAGFIDCGGVCAPSVNACGDRIHTDNERLIQSDSHKYRKSIVIDHENRPHVVTSGSLLAMHSRSGGEWESQTLWSAWIIINASVAVDEVGKLFVAYADNNQTSLRFAEETESGWEHTTVDHFGVVGAFASLELDAEGEPRIAYYDDTNENLKFAERNGGSWNVEVAHGSNSDKIGSHSSLVLARDGTPHIVYYDVTSTRRRILHARREGGEWIHQEVVGGMTYSIDAAIDGDDHIHVAFVNEAGDQAYAFWNGTQWSTETVDDSRPFRWSAIAIGPDGLPQMVYSTDRISSSRRGAMHHARHDGAQWEVTANLSDSEGPLDLAIDSDGVRHVVYSLGWTDHSDYRGTYYFSF